MSMGRVSINHVLKLISSFTDMSVFSYTESKVGVLLASLGLFSICSFAVCLLDMIDNIPERCMLRVIGVKPFETGDLRKP